MNLRQDAAYPSKWLDRLPFTKQQCDALFAAVLVDDKVDATIRLPDAILLNYDQEQITQCFRICRQMWMTGIDQVVFRDLIGKLRRVGTLGSQDRLAYKYIRAKYKQLRFAYANVDISHKYPRALDLVTIAMGHLQDDMKNGRQAAVFRRAILMRLLLMKPLREFVAGEVDQIRPSTPDQFRHYVLDQIDLIRSSLAAEELTGRQFHHLRKIISRQASFYVSLQTLYPTKNNSDTFRYLSSINGMMGSLHDDLIEKRSSKAQNYDSDRFRLPDDIRHRLTTVTDRYPKARSAC